MESLLDILQYTTSFLVIISVIVFVHEYGHFWVARRCGVKVEQFSIGFGKEQKGWNDKHGTRWKIALFPLGGYVKMFGDESAASTPDGAKLKKMTAKEREMAFQHKSLAQKAAIVFAGPGINFLFAIIVLAGLFVTYGRPESAPIVGTVIEESAADKAGFQPGDRVVNIDDTAIERFEDIRRITSLNPGTKLSFVIEREGKQIKGSITPRLTESKDVFGNDIKLGIVGITASEMQYRELGVVDSLVASVAETYSITANTLKAIGQMITGKRSTDELSGVLRIAKFSGQSTEQGLATVFWFMAMLSINLGLINLFPIPMLDGGHLMFYAIEAVSGRPLAERVQEYGFRVGFVLLVALMIFATINDLRHFNLF